jgi:peptidoglycan hydrolase CwlO-like protein
VSDPARPETAGRSAFVELEAVIRNVTDQLAVFRRRALSAESQVRELDQVTAHAAELAKVADTARRRIAELEHALSEAEAVASQAQAASAEAMAKAAAAAAAAASAPPTPKSASQHSADSELAAENAALRERLDEAAERTRQISERVRFLRQQIGNGSDK